MKKILLNTTVAMSLIASSFLFIACSDTTSEAEVIQIKPKTVQSEKKEDVKEVKTVYTKYDSVVDSTFKDVATLAPNGKMMLLVFGTNTDPYTDRLKADIQNSKELTKYIKNDFSSYYLKAHENLRHKLFHNGELMDVDTKTMLSIYAVTSTPTLIFTDKDGKAVIVVPGYMPTEQFIQTIKFMQSDKWVGKDRKNGEVYEELRKFYIDNGIEVVKAK
jgi:thioredoxin-related protein